MQHVSSPSSIPINIMKNFVWNSEEFFDYFVDTDTFNLNCTIERKIKNWYVHWKERRLNNYVVPLWHNCSWIVISPHKCKNIQVLYDNHNRMFVFTPCFSISNEITVNVFRQLQFHSRYQNSIACSRFAVCASLDGVFIKRNCENRPLSQGLIS